MNAYPNHELNRKKNRSSNLHLEGKFAGNCVNLRYERGQRLAENRAKLNRNISGVRCKGGSLYENDDIHEKSG